MKKCSEATQTLRTGYSKADPQTNKQTNREGRLQYTAQLSAQCNYGIWLYGVWFTVTLAFCSVCNFNICTTV